MDIYKHIRNFYNSLNQLLNYEVDMTKETKVLGKNEYEDYIKAYEIELKAMENIMEKLGYQYSTNLKLREYEYNNLYKNGEIVFINNNDGFFEYIIVDRVMYISGVHLLKEFRSIKNIKRTYNLLSLKVEETKSKDIIVICQKINLYIKKIYIKLGFTYYKDFDSLNEIWIIKSNLLKLNLKKRF